MSRSDKLQLIGEMGLNLSAIDSLSDEDFESLYAGYQRKTMTLGNLIIVAIRKALSQDSEPFSVPNKQASREETFKHLGLEEES